MWDFLFAQLTEPRSIKLGQKCRFLCISIQQNDTSFMTNLTNALALYLSYTVYFKMTISVKKLDFSQFSDDLNFAFGERENSFVSRYQ